MVAELDTKLLHPRSPLTVVSLRILAAMSESVMDGEARSPKIMVVPVSRMFRESLEFWRHKSTLALDVESKQPSCPVLHRELIELTPGSASPAQLIEEDAVPSRLISGLPFER